MRSQALQSSAPWPLLWSSMFVSLRYHEEVRTLFGRLEKFRADRRGIESTFSPPSETHKNGAGSPAEPPTEESEHELEPPEPANDEEKVDLQTASDLDVLHGEMVGAALNSDLDRAKEARNRYREVTDDAVEADRVDALFDALTFDTTGDQAFLKSLRGRVADSRIAAYVEYLTGMVLENVKQHSEAADAYKRALAAAKEPEFRAKLVGNRAKMLIEIRKADLAEQEVKMALREEGDSAAKAALWKALARTYEAREQYFDQAVALQEARIRTERLGALLQHRMGPESVGAHRPARHGNSLLSPRDLSGSQERVRAQQPWLGVQQG